MHYFQAFQLTLQTELYFPELGSPLPFLTTPVDVTIRFGHVRQEGIEAPVTSDPWFQAKPGQFWFNIPDVARFLVTDGQQIIIDPVAGIDEDSIRVFLLGSCMGALLMQRGFCLLHGNVVRVGQEAVAFTGFSGAGKSTLAGAFLQRGYSIISDDICTVNPNGEVIPGFPQLKLWADAAQKLAIDTTGLRKIRPDFDKYSVPLGDRFSTDILPLTVIYFLNLHDHDHVSFNHLSGLEKFIALRSQLYRRQYAEGLIGSARYMMQFGALANRTEFVRVMRPATGYQLDKLVGSIESDLHKRNQNTMNSLKNIALSV